jgi:hypothetical protein
VHSIAVDRFGIQDERLSVGLWAEGSDEPRSRDTWGASETELTRARHLYLRHRWGITSMYDRLCRAASFPPALFLALLEAQEQLPSPGRGEFVIRDGRDTDACATQPEMREDALAALPTGGNAFHYPAPYPWRGSRRPRGAGFCTRGQRLAHGAPSPPTGRVGAASLDGVCDHQISGDVVVLVSIYKLVR